MAHDDIYAKAVKAAEEELEQLSTQRRDLLDRVKEFDHRIQRVKQIAKALAAPRTPPSDAEGITEACKTVLKEAAGSDYTAKNVRDELMRRVLSAGVRESW